MKTKAQSNKPVAVFVTVEETKNEPVAVFVTVEERRTCSSKAMKTLKPGHFGFRPWWVGAKGKCAHCGREVELEATDEVEGAADYQVVLPCDGEDGCGKGQVVINNLAIT